MLWLMLWGQMTGKIRSESDQSRLTLKPPCGESDFWRFKSLPQNWSLWIWMQLISSCCSRTDCDTLISSGCYCSSFHLHVVMMMAAKFHPFVAGVFMMRSEMLKMALIWWLVEHTWFKVDFWGGLSLSSISGCLENEKMSQKAPTII